MNFRNISAWSIRNPIVPIVFFIGLTLAGLAGVTLFAGLWIVRTLYA